MQGKCPTLPPSGVQADRLSHAGQVNVKEGAGWGVSLLPASREGCCSGRWRQAQCDIWTPSARGKPTLVKVWKVVCERGHTVLLLPSHLSAREEAERRGDRSGDGLLSLLGWEVKEEQAKPPTAHPGARRPTLGRLGRERTDTKPDRFQSPTGLGKSAHDGTKRFKQPLKNSDAGKIKWLLVKPPPPRPPPTAG